MRMPTSLGHAAAPGGPPHRSRSRASKTKRRRRRRSHCDSGSSSSSSSSSSSGSSSKRARRAAAAAAARRAVPSRSPSRRRGPFRRSRSVVKRPSDRPPEERRSAGRRSRSAPCKRSVERRRGPARRSRSGARAPARRSRSGARGPARRSRSGDRRPNIEREKGGVKLFVGRLPQKVRHQELRECFEEYGEVVEVFVIDSQAISSVGCAFVRMAKLEQAERAISELHEQRCIAGLQFGPMQVAFAKGEATRLGLSEREETLPSFKEAKMKVEEHREKREFFEEVKKQSRKAHRAAEKQQKVYAQAANAIMLPTKELISLVKEGQRQGGSEFKQKWSTFCDQRFSGTADRDPARHRHEALAHFIAMVALDYGREKWFKSRLADLPDKPPGPEAGMPPGFPPGMPPPGMPPPGMPPPGMMPPFGMPMLPFPPPGMMPPGFLPPPPPPPPPPFYGGGPHEQRRGRGGRGARGERRDASPGAEGVKAECVSSSEAEGESARPSSPLPRPAGEGKGIDNEDMPESSQPDEKTTTPAAEETGNEPPGSAAAPPPNGAPVLMGRKLLDYSDIG